MKLHPIPQLFRKQGAENGISKVLVGLSGGADSVASAFAAREAGLEVIALHCNFHLRGEESNRDTKFVKEFCDALNLPLETKEFDVGKYLQEQPKTSLEMACRDLRYEWFHSMLQSTGFDRILTGHNADDNIETFFLNLLRGSGSRGLRGMKVDNGTVWRPLLSFHRREILEYIEANGLQYVVDSTNLESDFRRNYLRNKIIPLLKEEWKGFDTAMDKTIRNLEAENDLVENLLTATLPNDNSPLETGKILEYPAPLLIIKRFVDPYGPYATTPTEILSAIKANKPHIRRWKLRNGVVFLRNGKLFVEISHGESRT